MLDLKALSLKDKLENNEINKLKAYIKPLMNSATDRNTMNTDIYQFYFNKLLTSRCIKIQNDVLNKEIVTANLMKWDSFIASSLSVVIMIYNCIKPHTTVRRAAHVAAHTSRMLIRTNSFINGTSSMFHHHGYGNDDKDKYQRSCWAPVANPSSQIKIRIKKIRKIKNPFSQSGLIEKINLAKDALHSLKNL